MSRSNDSYGEMPKFPIDDDTAERLLTGAVAPEDAPPGYSGVAGLVRAATAPAVASETVGRDLAVAAMSYVQRASVGRGGSTTAHDKRRRSMLGKLLTLKGLAVALPAMALTAGTAAAATGSLPSSAQSAVSGALSNVGISVPNPDASQPDKATSTTSSTTSTDHGSAVGPSASGNAKYGLCTAYFASSGAGTSSSTGTSTSSTGTGGSVAFSNLAAAAKADGETITEFCQGVKPSGDSHSAGHSSTGSSESRSHEPSSIPSGTDHGNAPSGTGSSSGTGEPSSIPSGTGSDGQGAGQGHARMAL